MPAAAPSKVQIPRWTKRVATELGGRDPLGLSRVSSIITDYMLTGIITTTSRARYYSFYPWALWHIEQAENPKRYSEFTLAFRRREAFMALATLLNSADSSVVGVEAVQPRLEKSLEAGEVDTNFKVLPSNGLGGYGQYYGGSLGALGLTCRTEDGIERAVGQRGETIAQAFDGSVNSTPYCKQRHFTENAVPLPILRKSAERFSLDSLDRGYAAEERQLLRDLLFFWDRSNVKTDVLRRHTLGLILHSAMEYGKRNSLPSLREVDNYMVYPVYYYGVLWLEEGPSAPYGVPLPLATCYGFWRQFCLHEYLTQALEFLLYAVLEALNLKPSGMTVQEICDTLAGAKFRSTLANLFGKSGKPSLLFESVGVVRLPTEEVCRKKQAAFGAASDLSERALRGLDDGTAEVAAAISVALLAVLYSKWRNSRSEFSRYIESKAGGELWAGRVLPAIDAWLQTDLTWKTALRQLIQPFILDQHNRVKYEKGRPESCWLRRLEGKVSKEQNYKPVLRSSRHGNCVRILRDLGLLEIGAADDISITLDGRRMLARILKSDGARK